MRVSDYTEFVRRTDQSIKRKPADRKGIAYYGLIGEIGSVVSTVKKKLLAEGGESGWDQPNEEIKEEIGDALWYCFSLASVINKKPVDILAMNIAALRREVGAQNKRAKKIEKALSPAVRKDFLSAAKAFPPKGGYTFDNYQRLAFKTARTKKRILLEVCLAVLTQLGAELLRATLAKIELTLNKNIADRDPNTVLGEITWHLAAIASLYDLSLDDVILYNTKKVSFRSERGAPTALHDDGRQSSEQLPRVFDISFVQVAAGNSRMYFEGKQLGDDLTDNSRDEDGYRFHDVMHLAFMAHLGWSPVVRGMMGRKRPNVDKVEDHGRAKIVEELVIKAIHSEGEKQAQESGRCPVDGPAQLFPDGTTVPFQLLKTIHRWVQGLEVVKNTFWEWEDAICAGCATFYLLRKHKQGTVRVDLNNRRMTFMPAVTPGVSGITVGLGMGTATEGTGDSENVLSKAERAQAQSDGCLTQAVAAKKALLQALALPTTLLDQLRLEVIDGNKLSVSASGDVQKRVWALRAVDFKVAFATAGGAVVATVAAIADGT